MNKNSVAIITGSRAEYYQLQPVIKKLETTTEISLEILVSGDHLKNRNKGSLQDIKNSLSAQIHLFPIETTNSTPSDVCSQVSQVIEQFGNWFQVNKYDLIIVLGDRHEILGACTAALIHQIPIVHIHGGDISEGAIDDCIRHSITKMSHFHFPATQLSAKRIYQMGECSEDIFTVGSLGVENTSNNVQHSDHFTMIEKPFALLTCHSETKSKLEEIPNQQQEILEALKFYDGKVLITQSNCDLGGDKINQIHRTWEAKYPSKFFRFDNLGWKYHTVIKAADFCIGNSSSALIEAPALKTPSIDIGNRQKGRERGKSVIHCEWSRNSIKNAIKKCLNTNWINEDHRFDSPYQIGDSTPSELITRSILNILKRPIINKKFYLH